MIKAISRLAPKTEATTDYQEPECVNCSGFFLVAAQGLVISQSADCRRIATFSSLARRFDMDHLALARHIINCVGHVIRG